MTAANPLPKKLKSNIKFCTTHHVEFHNEVCKIAVSTPKSGHLILPYKVQDDLWLILHWNWEIPTVTYFLGPWMFTGVIPSSSTGSCPHQEMITTMVLMMWIKYYKHTENSSTLWPNVIPLLAIVKATRTCCNAILTHSTKCRGACSVKKDTIALHMKQALFMLRLMVTWKATWKQQGGRRDLNFSLSMIPKPPNILSWKEFLMFKLNLVAS